MCRRLLLALCFAGLASPSSAEPVDADGDSLPPGSVRRFGSTRYRIPAPVTDVCYSPDGKLLAASAYHYIVVWDRATGKRVHLLTGHKPDSAMLTFTPDSKRLLSMGKEFIIWDAATGRELTRRDETGRVAEAKAFSPDLSRVAMIEKGVNSSFWVHDLKQPNKELTAFRGEKDDFVVDIAWSPDGKRLASACFEGPIRIWDAISVRALREFKCAEAKVHCVTWWPDGKRIVIGDDAGRVRVLDAESGKEALKLVEVEGPRSVFQIRFTPDGKRIVATTSTAIQVWDAASGKHLRRIDFAEGQFVTCLCISPDGSEVASYEGAGTIRRYDLNTGRLLSPRPGPESGGVGLAVSPTGAQLIAAGFDASVQTWSVEDGRSLRSFRTDGKGWMAVRLSADGSRAAARSSDSSVTIWDVSSGKKLKTLTANLPWLGSHVLSHDGRYCAADFANERVAIWDTASGKLIQSLKPGYVSSVNISPDGRLLALLHDAVVEIWDVGRGKKQYAMAPPQGAKYSNAEFSTDGRDLALLADDGSYRLVEAVSGKEVIEGKLPEAVSSVTFSPGARVLACELGHDVRQWHIVEFIDLATGKTLSPRRAEFGVSSVVFAPDGQNLYAGCTDGTILCWKVPALSAIPAPPPDAMAGLVENLCGGDARAARQAHWALAKAPERAIAELRRWLTRRPAPDARRVRRLISELDDAKYDTRADAARQLAALGHIIEPELRKAHAGSKSTNLRRELDRLLDDLVGPPLRGDTVGVLRVIALLEAIGTPEAIALLREHAKADIDTIDSREASAALIRLQAKADRK
jgi:WD40 repeat protein